MSVIYAAKEGIYDTSNQVIKKIILVGPNDVLSQEQANKKYENLLVEMYCEKFKRVVE